MTSAATDAILVPQLYISSYLQASMAAWLLEFSKLKNFNGFHPFLFWKVMETVLPKFIC